MTEIPDTPIRIFHLREPGRDRCVCGTRTKGRSLLGRKVAEGARLCKRCSRNLHGVIYWCMNAERRIVWTTGHPINATTGATNVILKWPR